MKESGEGFATVACGTTYADHLCKTFPQHFGAPWQQEEVPEHQTGWTGVESWEDRRRLGGV